MTLRCQYFTRFGGHRRICWLVGGAAVSLGSRMIYSSYLTLATFWIMLSAALQPAQVGPNLASHYKPVNNEAYFNHPNQQKCAYSALHPQALTECSPWNSEDRLLTVSQRAWCCRLQCDATVTPKNRWQVEKKPTNKKPNYFLVITPALTEPGHCVLSRRAKCTCFHPYSL